LNDPIQSSTKIDTAMYGSRNDDAAPGYRPRYRHNKDKHAGVLYLDGHCDTVAFKELRYRNFGVEY